MAYRTKAGWVEAGNTSLWVLALGMARVQGCALCSGAVFSGGTLGTGLSFRFGFGIFFDTDLIADIVFSLNGCGESIGYNI